MNRHAAPTSPEEADLRRLHRVKQQNHFIPDPLGPDLIKFFKTSVEKRHTKLGAISKNFAALIPPHLLDHCALESLHAGTLKVIVDSAPHLYELKQVLLAGLQEQLLLSCRSSGLRKIALKIGRWYDSVEGGTKLRF